MKIEVRATYPATDGSMPEDVSVEIEVETTSVNGAALADVVLPVLERMLTAPRGRALTGAGWSPAIREQLPQDGINAPMNMAARMDMPAEVLNEECRRTGCGHRRYSHLDITADGERAGPYLGRCFNYDNSHCPYFVGVSVEGEKA